MARITISDVEKMKNLGMLESAPQEEKEESVFVDVEKIKDYEDLVGLIIPLKNKLNSVIDKTNELTENPGTKKMDSFITELTKLSSLVDMSFLKLGISKETALKVLENGKSSHKNNRGVLETL